MSSSVVPDLNSSSSLVRGTHCIVGIRDSDNAALVLSHLCHEAMAAGRVEELFVFCDEMVSEATMAQYTALTDRANVYHDPSDLASVVVHCHTTPRRQRLVVLADHTNAKAFFRSKAARQLLFNGRHFGATILIALNYWGDLPKEMNAQVDNLFVLGPVRSMSIVQQLHQTRGSRFPFVAFGELLTSVLGTGERGVALVLSVEDEPKRYRFPFDLCAPFASLAVHNITQQPMNSTVAAEHKQATEPSVMADASRVSREKPPTRAPSPLGPVTLCRRVDVDAADNGGAVQTRPQLLAGLREALGTAVELVDRLERLDTQSTENS